jgi:raffinose/stachyose/melibiose transport system substrate-binding protein
MKRIVFVLSILAAIICLVGCSQDTSAQFGTLEINIKADVSKGIQAMSMETVSYNVTVKDSSESVVFLSSGKAQTSYTVSLSVGTFTVYVEALNSEGDVIGTGSSVVSVAAGQVSSCSITVSELTGTGTFDISITANEGYPLAYSIKSADGTEVKSGSLAYDNGTYHASESLANGFYTFTIIRTDTNKVLKTDSLRIIKDKSVSYSATFQFMTDGSIVIINEITSTPTISISLSSTTPRPGDILTATASLSGITAGYTCFWAVDGVPLSEAGEYENLEYEISDSAEGEHEVSLFVIEDPIIWSESKSFSVSDKMQIRVLNYLNLSDPNSANEISQIWDHFSDLHPEIEIVREDLYGEQFHAKVQHYVETDQLPDVMYVWSAGRSTTLHTEHLLYDLEPLLRRDGLFDDYAATCTAPQIGGYLAELPSGLTASSMMFVNEKVLRENNLEVPETYDDLKAMVPVLNAKGIEVISMDCHDDWVMQSCLFSLVAGRFGGADWYDRLIAGEIDFEDDWFKDALTVIDNLYKDGIINRNTLSISYGSGRADFAAGKSAFYIDGDWACGSFQTDQSTGEALISTEQQISDISLMNFPALDGEIIHESNSAIVGTGWAISADIDPDKLEAAWTLVKYLQSEYVQTWRLITGAAFPSLTSIDVAKVCEENNLEPLVAKRSEWYGRIQVVTPIIDGVLDPSVYQVVDDVLAEIGAGTSTVDEAAADVNQAWQVYDGLHPHRMELVLLSAGKESESEAIIEAFTAKYPNINVTHIEKSSTEILSLVQTSASDSDVVLLIAEDSLISMEPNLYSYTTTNDAKFSAEYKGENDKWYACSMPLQILMYNTDLLSGEDIPTSWFDLADPKYNGMIALINPLSSGSGYAQLYMMYKLAADDLSLAQAIVQNGTVYYSDAKSGPQAVARGEYALTITGESNVSNAIKNGSPVNYLYPEEGTGRRIEGAGIIDGCNNLVAAKIFMDWFTGKDGAAVIRSCGRRPVSTEVLGPENLPALNEITFFDYDAVEAAQIKNQLRNDFAALL